MASASNTIQLTSSGGNKADLYVYFNETDTSTTNNQSKIYVYGSIKMTSGGYSVSSTPTLYIYWHNNATNTNTLMGSVVAQALSRGNTADVSGEAWFDHYSDGTGSGYAYAYWEYTASNAYVPRTGTSYTANTALTTIARASKPSCPDTLIGNTATISTNRTSTDFYHTISYTVGGTTTQIATNVLESVGWTVPSSIYSYMASDESEVVVTINCTTYKDVNGTPTQIGTTQTTTMRAGAKTSDCQPDFDFNLALTDGTATSSLTGNQTSIIKGFTTSQLTWSATAKHGANISRVYLENYDANYTTSPINLNTEIDTNAELLKGGINARCYDSRGFNKPLTKTYTIIDYFAPQLEYSARRTTPTGSEVKVQFNGSFFNASFGSVSNTLTLKWRYKEKGGSWSNYTTLTQNTHYKVNGNNFYSGTGSSMQEITLSSSVFDYSKSYTIEISIQDQINSYAVEKNVPKGEPVFWWSGDNFYIKKDTYVKGNAVATTDQLAPMDNNFNYSSTEVEIGKWIDGRTLYRKVISLSAFPNNASVYYNTDISNLRECVKVFGVGISNTGNSFPLPYFASASSNGGIEMVYLKSENQIRITTYMDRSALTGYAYMEYTKN